VHRARQDPRANMGVLECKCGTCGFRKFPGMDPAQAAQLAALPTKTMQFAVSTRDPRNPVKESARMVPVGRVTCIRCKADFDVDVDVDGSGAFGDPNSAVVFVERHGGAVKHGGVTCPSCTEARNGKHGEFKMYGFEISDACLTANNVVCDIVVESFCFGLTVQGALFDMHGRKWPRRMPDCDPIYAAFMRRNDAAIAARIQRNVRVVLLCCQRNKIDKIADVLRGPIMARLYYSSSP
jgi:hypothetical protein